NYYGIYLNDDWKVSSKLTLNLGVRWDYFQPVYEHHGAQANFTPTGPPTGGPAYLIPQGNQDLSYLTNFDCSNLADKVAQNSLKCLAAKDGIALSIGNFGKSLAEGEKHNFAPRFGFAYQATPKLVARGGFGIFYNGFENRGFSPNLGENYPFQFNFQFATPNDNTPIIYKDAAGNPCSALGAGPIGNATLETGFACTPLDPLLVLAKGLALRGIQFDYKTPYTMGGNFTVQYQFTPTLSLQTGYVTSLGRHLEVFPNSNNVTQILPKGAPQTVPFADFGKGSSYATTDGSSFYHGLQATVEKRFGQGLNFLGTYTWSKVMSD